MWMSKANGLFSMSFINTSNRFSHVQSFRRLAEMNLNEIAPSVHNEWSQFYTDLCTNEKYRDLFEDRDALLKEADRQKDFGFYIDAMTGKDLNVSIDAASLVFMHSVIDSAVYEFCHALAYVSPLSWERYVSKKKVAIDEIKEDSYQSILNAKILQYVNSLERESLLTKIDHIFQVCKPIEGFTPIENYKFDRDRVEGLDRLRHDVVHGAGQVVRLPKGDEDIWYLFQTSNYLMLLINKSFELKITPYFSVQEVTEQWPNLF